MRTIWKFPLEVVDEQTIPMPRDAVILDIQTQRSEEFCTICANAPPHEHPCIWALVESEHILESRVFRTIGTGHEVPDNLDELNYVGSYQLNDGRFLGHVFEVVEDE